MTTTSSRMTSSDLAASLDIVEVKPGLRFSKQTLLDLLPDAETVLFFGKVYKLDYIQLSRVMALVLNSPLAQALFEGAHSVDLQGYLVKDIYDYGPVPDVEQGDITFSPDVPKGEILPEVWASLEVDVADSIKAVAAKLESVVGKLPGKQGSMLFKSMMTMNAKRPTLGSYKAHIHHDPVKENLLILDVSGSMSAPTIKAIIEDVVALSYKANAHMAVVSDTTTHWEPGSYSVENVLDACEYSGTHYETLEDLLHRNWGTVITVADYDSSRSAKDHLDRQCRGHVDQVLDISLVYRPTFLAECVGQLADEVKPLLIANGYLI